MSTPGLDDRVHAVTSYLSAHVDVNKYYASYNRHPSKQGKGFNGWFRAQGHFLQGLPEQIFVSYLCEQNC